MEPCNIRGGKAFPGGRGFGERPEASLNFHKVKLHFMIWLGGTFPWLVKDSFILQESDGLFFNARWRENIPNARSCTARTAVQRKGMENA